jgi:hypothetical protein
MVETEMVLEEGVILRMKLIVALGCASAREKRPEADTAEGGKGAGG